MPASSAEILCAIVSLKPLAVSGTQRHAQHGTGLQHPPFPEALGPLEGRGHGAERLPLSAGVAGAGWVHPVLFGLTWEGGKS